MRTALVATCLVLLSLTPCLAPPVQAGDAITSPAVAVVGNGFEPNGDTLDAPLPVKVQ